MFRTIALASALGALGLTAPAMGHGSGMTDGQVAHIAYTAGQLDIAAARQALERSKNPEVLAFAETMLRDHEAVNQQAITLLKRLSVTPEANPTSASLAAEAERERKRLATLEGQAFDLAYAAREAGFHAAVNKALKTTLIPAAHNAELKSLLEAGLALFSAHQDHAEALAGKLR